MVRSTRYDSDIIGIHITISFNTPLDFKALGPPDDVSACVDIAMDGVNAGQVPPGSVQYHSPYDNGIVFLSSGCVV